jgi:hypothetical protein
MMTPEQLKQAMSAKEMAQMSKPRLTWMQWFLSLEGHELLFPLDRGFL